jgi:hypothetical protein
MAFLLGTRDGAKVCRYERFLREPSLEMILAYEAIFQKPARELFAGLYRKIERGVAQRARVLSDRVKRQKSGRMTERKRQVLAAILAGQRKRTKHRP